jgi:hypothetical protein
VTSSPLDTNLATMHSKPDVAQPGARAGLVLAASMTATFTLLRVALTRSPNSDFDVLGYNVHHLFTGVLIVVAAAIPIAIGVRSQRLLTGLTALLGVGLGLVLDEWVYLIVTDGSNASYLLPESFIGGVVLIALASVYAITLSIFRSR